MSMPLEGIRVLDCTIWQMGPVASALLADLGAEVIKIEEPVGGDPGRGTKRIRGKPVELPQGKSWYFEYTNHNKKGITLDLRSEAGKQVLFRLVKKSDVFVQNLRLGIVKRLGIDYKTLSGYNPRIIYASATGFGSRGADANEPAFDLLGQARSGMMTTAGEPDAPPVVHSLGMADQIGAIMLAYGVLAALLARERLGIGQEVEVSHLGSAITLIGLEVFASLATGHALPLLSRKQAPNPVWNIYECSDGKWITLAMFQPDRQWPAVCKALELQELVDDPRFCNMERRSENCSELIAIFDKVFTTQSCAEWMRRLKQAGDIICSPVNTLEDLPHDQQVIENEYIVDFDHPALGRIKFVGLPVRFSKTPGAIRLPAPEFGQHTEEVLLDIGEYSWEEIAELREKGVI